MYGRLVEIENIDPSRREEALENIRENVIPALMELDGFAGFISLADEGNRRARSIVLWETKENAEEAERQMASRREEMVSRLGATVRSADLYEAPIVDVRAGVKA
jgi:heme-degrading monooxygenase HmoA